MITVRMKRSVSGEYRKGEIYELPNSLAIEFIMNGWATRRKESTAVSPAKRTATLMKVSKR